MIKIIDVIKKIKEEPQPITTKKQFLFWFKADMLGKKKIDGYIYKWVENEPIVGARHFKGYVLINSKTNEIAYINVNYWGVIGDRLMDYDPKVYDIVVKIFPQNVL